MKQDHFRCKFCEATFTTESRYLKHYCKQMKRDEELKTPLGQAAWHYYQDWMKAYRRMAPSIESFAKSKYYRSFYRFAEHVKKLNIPDIQAFINLMKEKDISPTIWTNDQVYALYLEYLDRRASPIRQAKITIDTLFKIADAADCDVGDVFEVLYPNEVITLLRQRQLSPWILLFSAKFKDFLVNKTTNEQQIVMESIIRPQYWSQKFQKSHDYIETMKTYVKELNL